MADIQLRSYQQIVGAMIAKMLAETDVTDLSPGSVFLTTLEAAASSDFTQEGKILNLLRLRDVDKAKGVDLENLASELGVSPSRQGAESSNVFVKIFDTSFTKISSSVFAGAVSPASGDTTLKVEDASLFPASGTIYIGRGTSTSEAISYSAKSNAGQYWLLTLSSPLTKDHLVNEEVVIAQGGDRPVLTGTIVRVPAGAGNAAIEFRITRDVVLPDGEDAIENVPAVATVPGSSSNVGIGKISEFGTLPFSTADVVNDLPAEDGRDAETDTELRQRIKDHVHNLARGTQRAIISNVLGVNDSDENKRVVSAFIKEPTSVGALGILFIDDGTGFKPSFSGIGEEVIVTSAAGTEQFFQLQKFPLVKAQLASVGVEPFALDGGEKLSVDVDGEIEERAIPSTNYRTPGVVTAQEVAEAINLTFTTIEARAKDGVLFITPIADDPDYIRVGIASSNDANDALLFPLRKQYTIRLYKNERLLEKNGFEAVLQSKPNTQWPVFGASETLQLKIDGINSPTITVTDSDFSALTSSNTINGASVSDWVIILNAKFIGITAKSRDDGTFIIVSNRGRSDLASLSVIGGSLNGTLMPLDQASTGAGPEFKLNRLLGQIELTDRLAAEDNLKAGTVNTAGFAETLAQSTFDLSTTLGSQAEMVIVPDAEIEILPVSQSGALTFSSPSTAIQRITGVASQFSEVVVDDWCYMYNMPRAGVFKVRDVAGDGSYVDVYDPDPQTTSDTPNGTTKKIIFWRSTGLPQIVKFTTGAAVTNATVASDFNTQISGATAEVLDSSIVRFQTQRLDGDGGLGIPAVSGTASNLGVVAANYASNDPHIAAVESADLLGLPSQRLTISTADLTDPFDDLQANGTPFTVENHNRPIMGYLGHHPKLPRQPLERLTTSRLTLRDDAPLQRNGIGDDLKAVSSAASEFGEEDNMVFIIDNDPAKKTFDIPMYVEATIAGPSVPSTTQFDATDGAGDLLGTSSRWLDYRFSDYRVWFLAKGYTPFSALNTEIKITAQHFGPNGQNILFGIFYPTTSNQDASASYSLDSVNSDILISAFLGSGADRAFGLTPNTPVQVTVTGPSGGFYTYNVQFITPVDLSTILVGDIMNLADTAFSAANQGTIKIDTITNLSDTTRSYQHLAESFSNATVSTATNVVIGSVPTQTVEVGDKIKAVSITKLASAASTSSTVTVATGGAYAAGGGTFVSNATTFTYTSYTSGTGVFAGVTPDPSAIVNIGDSVTQSITPVENLVTVVNTTTDFDVAVPGFTDGDGWDIVITHKAITADAAPSFVVAAGDKIQVSSQVLTVTSVVSTTIFEVDNAFTFTGLQAGTVSRIKLTGKKVSNGVNETITTTSFQGVRVYPLSGTTATQLETAINNTAGVKDLILASDATGSNGSGAIPLSTADELADGNTRFRLQNGEDFVYSSTNASPAIQLKYATDTAPEIGEKVRFIPMTPQNIADHFNKKQISGLSIAADVELVNGARHVQISSKIPGAAGQVFAVGGKASGNSSVSIRGASQEISSTIGVIQVDSSSLSLFAPNQTIYLTQSGLVKKSFVGASPDSLTTVQIQTVSPTTARLTFGVPLAAIYSYTHTGTVTWAVRKLTRNRVRYELISGTATLPASVRADDWVLIGDGSTYAGTTPLQVFASANQGYFQIRETDNATYFDVDNVSAAEEFIDAASAPFVFMPYHSARPGDKVFIGADSPFSTANKGTFKITAINSLTEVDYLNSSAINEGPSALGSLGVDSIRIIDQGFTTYRKILAVCPNPLEPTELGQIVLTPGYDTSLLNEDNVAKISFPNRLGFDSNPIPGISGYQYWTGLKRTVQRVLDGYAPDAENFPGVRASGVAIEAREPQIQRVTLNIKVKTKEGVALASIIDPIKSNVVGFINSLGLGQDVILSEIVSIIQSTGGVESVILVSPTLDTERITISDKAVPRTTPSEIFIS